MIVPKAPAEAWYEVQRSKFLALALPMASAEDARLKLKELKAQHAEAAHVVHAFCIGPEASRVTGYSDDGEPPGTAGRPLMEVVAGSGVTNVFVAVVRWFGGIKLGTGGLVKAYSEAGKLVLAALPVQEFVAKVRGRVSLSYADYEVFKRQWPGWEAEAVHEDFGAGVEVELELPAAHRSAVNAWLQDQTRGRVQLLTAPD